MLQAPTRSSSRASILTRERLAGLVVLLALTGAAQAADILLPPAGSLYDSQLGGAYRLPAGVGVVSRDREDATAAGVYNICYINAFQTQPQESAWWLTQHPGLLVQVDGQPLEDPNWPGEFLLDLGTADKRARLIEIVTPWIAGCAAAGFDAIEADNLDSYGRSDGQFGLEEALDYAGELVRVAHAHGLAAAQKNGPELGTRGKAAGFDFAITESCLRYDECDAYTDVFGERVFDIEYAATPDDAALIDCAGRHFSVIVRNRNLSNPDDPAYVYRAC